MGENKSRDMLLISFDFFLFLESVQGCTAYVSLAPEGVLPYFVPAACRKTYSGNNGLVSSKEAQV